MHTDLATVRTFYKDLQLTQGKLPLTLELAFVQWMQLSYCLTGLTLFAAGAADGQGQDEADEEVEASGTCASKKLIKVLHCQVLDPAVVVGCESGRACTMRSDNRLIFTWMMFAVCAGIVEQHAYVLYARMPEDRGIMTYYVPLLCEA